MFARSPLMLNIRVRREYPSLIPTIPVCILPPFHFFFLYFPINWKLLQMLGATTSKHVAHSQKKKIRINRLDFRKWSRGIAEAAPWTQ